MSTGTTQVPPDIGSRSAPFHLPSCPRTDEATPTSESIYPEGIATRSTMAALPTPAQITTTMNTAAAKATTTTITSFKSSSISTVFKPSSPFSLPVAGQTLNKPSPPFEGRVLRNFSSLSASAHARRVATMNSFNR